MEGAHWNYEGGHTGGLSGQGLGDTLGGKGHLGVVNWKTH